MKKIFLLSALLCPLSIFADDQYILRIEPGKKILNVSEFELPPSTTLAELLDIFPELLAREGDTHLSNYDIQLNDVSCGMSGETLLGEIKINQINVIEVSQHPSKSQQIKGQGGVINVKLKPVDEGLNGNVSFGIGSMFDVAPYAAITYRKGDVELRGLLNLEYYHPHSNTSILRMEQNAGGLSTQCDTTDNHYGFEQLRVMMKYNPSDKHLLEAWASEGFSRDIYDTRSVTYTEAPSTMDRTFTSTNKINLVLGAKYKYTMPRSFIEVKLVGENMRNRDTYYKESAIVGQRTKSENLTHDVSGFAKYCYQVVPTTPTQKLELTGGVNYAYTPKSYVSRNEFLSASTVNATSKGLYLSPYFEFKSKFSKYEIFGGFNYQFRDRLLNVYNIGEENILNRYFAADIKFGWQIAPHHYLSLVADRSVKTPADHYLFPLPVESHERGGYIVGNSYLKPESSHNLVLNYIFDSRREDGREMIFNTSIIYSNLQNTISPVKDGILTTFKNNGHGDVAAANAMFMYSYGIFGLNVTANVFQNWTEVAGVKDSYFYYNISLTPKLSFEGDWRLAAKFVYNSNIITKTSNLSNYFYSQVMLSKTWNKWTVFITMEDNFHKYAEDSILGEKFWSAKYYNLHRPSLNIGFDVVF